MNARGALVAIVFAAMLLAVGRGGAPAPAAGPVARDLGRLAATTPVKIALVLRYRHLSELRDLVRRQSDPHSALYRHYVNEAQWDAYFAPAPDAVAAARRALAAAGFRLEPSRPKQGLLMASAPAATVERYFGTEMHAFAQPSHGVRYANVRPASLPAAIRPYAERVAGLNSFVFDATPRLAAPILAGAFEPEKRRHRHPKPISTSTPSPNPSPEATLLDGAQYVHGKSGALGPVAVAVAYDYPVQHYYAGRGRTVGNIISADYTDSDLAAFFSEFAITPGGKVTRIDLDGGPGGGTAGQLEATTDVEAILGTAPNANYYEYLIPVLDELEIENAYAKAIADNVADVVNSSFGVCESQDPAAEYDFDQLALQGNAKGITFVAATGDGGSTECPGPQGQNTQQGIDVPSAGYYFTALGATDLDVNPVNGDYVSETASSTSGGGYSIFLPLPTWQAATTGALPNGRNVPDLALLGGSASGYNIVINGVDLPSSGTSVASALFCGYVAELDEIQKRRTGWLNPRLYAIQNAQGYTFAFHDVTQGSNGLFNAGPGYDLVSGIGSILGWELAGTF